MFLIIAYSFSEINQINIIFLKINKKTDKIHLWYGPIAQLVRVSVWHTEGRGFDSHWVHITWACSSAG